MLQNKNLHAFLPETALINSKQEQECRIFHNDCAVLNAKDDLRVVASRGFGDAVGVPFFKLLRFSPAMKEKFSRFLLSDHPALLLPSGSASLIFFSAWYSATGLILAVRLPKKESTLRKIIENNTRPSLLSVFSIPETQKDTATADTEKMIDELFYYTQRIFSDPAQSPLTQAHLLANLAGCRLEQLDLPYDPPFPTKALHDRYSAFLLCVFLALRQTGGAVSAVQSKEKVEKVQNQNRSDQVLDFSFSISQKKLSKAKTTCDPQPNPDPNYRFLFPFMELPCFRSFKLNQNNGEVIFDVAIEEDTAPALFAPSFIPMPLWWRFTLRPLKQAIHESPPPI